MFNFFFRPYVPGFRVRPQDGVPGFNVDENGLSPHTASQTDTLQASDVPMPEREFVIQAAPITDLPGFRLYPQYDVPGFNVNEDGPPPYSIARADTPHVSAVPTPARESLIQAAPASGVPGFRIDAQHDVPGFNVRLRNDVVGFNLDENNAEQQDPTWSAQPLNLPTDIEEGPAQSDPLLPEWPYGRVIIPARPPTDPNAGPRISTYPLSGVTSAEVPETARWPSPNGRQQAPDATIRSGAATMQQHNSQPVAWETMPSSWLQPQKDGWLHAQRAGALSPIPSVRFPATSSFVFANTGDASAPPAQQPTPLQQYLATHRLPLGAGPTMVPLPETSRMKMTALEREPGPDSFKFVQADRGLEETEARYPFAANPSRQPPLIKNEVSHTSSNEEPSLGQRLAQSSVDALVPGAHYQNLARQQLDAKNYVGAAVYQTAALADAVLGVATLGLSTRAAAAGRAAAAEGAALFRRSFDSLPRLQRYLGRAPKGMHWHHIVEQSQAAQFGQRRIQSVENIVAIPIEAHYELSAFYSSKQPFSEPNRVREWLRGKSFEEQYEHGIERLKQVLGY
jgi:hypothetical protein